MVQVKIVQIHRDGRGVIASYTVADENGATQQILSETLKLAMQTGELSVENAVIVDDNIVIRRNRQSIGCNNKPFVLAEMNSEILDDNSLAGDWDEWIKQPGIAIYPDSNPPYFQKIMQEYKLYLRHICDAYMDKCYDVMNVSAAGYYSLLQLRHEDTDTGDTKEVALTAVHMQIYTECLDMNTADYSQYKDLDNRVAIIARHMLYRQIDFEVARAEFNYKVVLKYINNLYDLTPAQNMCVELKYRLQDDIVTILLVASDTVLFRRQVTLGQIASDTNMEKSLISKFCVV